MRSIRRFLGSVFFVSLTGCVVQNMNKGLEGLIGDNISVAVNELGYPDDQRVIMGNTVYIWGNSQMIEMPMTTFNTTTGSVNGIPYAGTNTSTNYVPENFHCEIQIAVDGTGDIIHTQWAGNIGGCASYANAVKVNAE